jgi:23S rRNA pseudouridine2605 synthase
MPEERLQKILAHAGIASRRKAEDLILAGRVSVNGKTVTELGSKADLAADSVKVDGRVLSAPKHHLYIAFHKPKNVVTTLHDPEGRKTILSFFKGLHDRIYPIGRLDYASEGLLLLTNDGDFANKLMSPASHVVKTYLVKANGALTLEQEQEFRRGIPMHGRRTAPAGLKLVRKGDNPWYEVRLVEGRQNQIRIMFKHFGRLVEKLKRVQIGFLPLGDLKPGAYRTLTNTEVARFRKLIHLDAEPHRANIKSIMNDHEMTELLRSAKTIAVVGLSSNPMRPSFGVSRFLQRQGFRIIPVNPNETEVLGERAYASVKEVPDEIDIVNIFRRPARVPEVVNDALVKGARCIWMQEGVVNHEAARKAESAGLSVVMDRCILKELARLLPYS